MQIFEEPAFMIKQECDNSYIFYNSIRHFACRISELDLIIFNLIYVYHNFDEIKKNISKEYVHLVRNIYDTVIKSGVLSTEPIYIPDSNVLMFPSSYYLHLTYKCNLNCVYCYNKKIRNNFEELDLNNWKTIIDKISPYALHLKLTGGEPFLSKNLSDIIKYIRSVNKSVDIEIISNCMTDFENYDQTQYIFQNIDRVTFSCDNLTGVNQQRVNFDSEIFKRNIIYLKKSFKDLIITISSVHSVENKCELNCISDFSSNERVSFKSVLIVPNSLDEIVLLPPLDEFIKTLPKIRKKLNVIRKYCGAGMGLLSIDPLGNVYPCQSLHVDKFKIGNLLTNSLDVILKSTTISYIKEHFNIDYISRCKDCNLKYICGGGCRAATFNMEADPAKYPQILCEYYKAKAMNELSNIPFDDQNT